MQGAREISIGSFVEQAGARTPTPGGGAIAAAGGALGVSMALMAARFTTGKKKFASVAEEIEAAISELETLSGGFLDLIDADKAAYSGVNEAYSLPRETDEEKAKKKAAIRAACVNAAKPPQEMLASCKRALTVTARLSEIANPMLMSDVGVAAEMLSGAAGAAFLNVKVNAEVIRGEDGDKLLADANAALTNCRSLAAATMERM